LAVAAECDYVQYRYPEVRAISAFTRVFDALWRASKDDRPGPSPFEGRCAIGMGWMIGNAAVARRVKSYTHELVKKATE